MITNNNIKRRIISRNARLNILYFILILVAITAVAELSFIHGSPAGFILGWAILFTGGVIVLWRKDRLGSWWIWPSGPLFPILVLLVKPKRKPIKRRVVHASGVNNAK